MLKSMQVENESIWPGHVPRSEVMKYLQQMHVFVMAPEHPGISNSLLEAAAAGVPIVATAIEGIKDFFSHGINCLLVPPGNAIALSRAIETIIRDDSLACHLGTGARRLVETLSLTAEKSKYCKLYAHLLDNVLLETY
jgi:glycosyltransferase involved in cell wall biosynthesis